MAAQTPATIYQVAERAGVSISTVSLAINHPERVNSVTRARVLAAADDLGFVPKERAIARAKAGVGRIAVVAPYTSYPSYAERVAGVLEEIGDDGTQVVIFDHEDVANTQSPLLETLPVRGHVDGLIIMGIPLEERIADRLAERLPTVLVDQRSEKLSSIWVDDFGGGQIVGARLLGWGHRRVVFVRDSETSYLEKSPANLRVNGLRSVLGDEGVRELAVTSGETAGDEVLRVFWGENADWRPTAVFGHRDLLALSVVGALRRAGMQMPGDVSVIGYDDEPAAGAVGLTTVANPLRESGRQAVRVLRRRILTPSAPPEMLELPLMFRDRLTAGASPVEPAS